MYDNIPSDLHLYSLVLGMGEINQHFPAPSLPPRTTITPAVPPPDQISELIATLYAVSRPGTSAVDASTVESGKEASLHSTYTAYSTVDYTNSLPSEYDRLLQHAAKLVNYTPTDITAIIHVIENSLETREGIEGKEDLDPFNKDLRKELIRGRAERWKEDNYRWKDLDADRRRRGADMRLKPGRMAQGPRGRETSAFVTD